MEMIKFPNCEGFFWFCNKARFFALQPHILLQFKKNIKRGAKDKKRWCQFWW